MDHGTDAPAVGALADGTDMAHELLPLVRVHAGCAVIVTGIEIALVVAPVHDGHVGGRELLALHDGQLGQPVIGDQLADVVHCLQDGGLIGGIDQIVEDGAGDDRQLVLLQLLGDDHGVDGHVAVGAQFDGCVAGLVRLGQDLGPLGKIGILGIVNAPARRSSADLHRHGIYLLYFSGAGRPGLPWREDRCLPHLFSSFYFIQRFYTVV